MKTVSLNSQENIDHRVVAGFGEEWTKFDHRSAPPAEQADLFNKYFGAFPWRLLPHDAKGFDFGCGTGRWAKFVAPRVGELHCIDPSPALEIARRNLADFRNCRFHNTLDDVGQLDSGSADFGYSLGVLHHLPDPAAGMTECVKRLKPGAPFLIYMYYAFDNKPGWFRAIWKCSNMARTLISRLPFVMRSAIAEIIALSVYWPLAKFARAVEALGLSVENLPLSAYRSRTLYGMRTDALDRFGTRLEWRFTRPELTRMMKDAGLENIQFHEGWPYWCAVGIKGSD